MADIIDVKVDASRVNLKLEKFPEDVRRELLFEIELVGGRLVDRVRARAQEALQVRTGKFLSRIRFGLKRSKNSLFGRVFSSDKRANIFEWGGHTGPHDIEPTKARALLLQMRGGNLVRAHVHHPGGKYAPRQIFHEPFDEMKPEIQAGLEGAVAGAAERASV